MNHQVPEDVADHVDQQRKLKKSEAGLDSKEVYFNDDGRPSKKVVLVYPVQNRKGQDKQYVGRGHQQPVERHHVSKHDVEGILLCEVELWALVQFVELDLEQVDVLAAEQCVQQGLLQLVERDHLKEYLGHGGEEDEVYYAGGKAKVSQQVKRTHEVQDVVDG